MEGEVGEVLDHHRVGHVIVGVRVSVSLVSARESRSVDHASASGSSQAGHKSFDSRGRRCLSRQPTRHVAKWHVRSHSGVTKRCAAQIQG